MASLQVKTLQRALDRRSANVLKVESNLTQICDAVEQESAGKELALSPQIVRIQDTIFKVSEKKGWLQRPKKNFRKNRWEPCFCKVTADAFHVYGAWVPLIHPRL